VDTTKISNIFILICNMTTLIFDDGIWATYICLSVAEKAQRTFNYF